MRGRPPERRQASPLKHRPGEVNTPPEPALPKAAHEVDKQEAVRAVEDTVGLWRKSQVQDTSDGTSYLQLVKALQRNPASDDFVYLRRARRHPADVNPYAFQVVAYVDRDPAEVYTLSARGVTLARPGAAAEFTTLERWLAEAAAFAQLRSRPAFRGFRAWKRFRIWWRTVRLEKIAAAREALEGSLVVQAHHHLRALHELCWALGGLRMHRVDLAQAPSLSMFTAEQATALGAAGATLASFSAATAAVMVAGCAEALQALQGRLDHFAQRQEAAQHARMQPLARAVLGGGEVVGRPDLAAEPAQLQVAPACLLSIEVLLSSDSRSLVFSPSQEAVQKELAALVKSWVEHLAQFKGPGASPELCELLEEEEDFVPTGPPLADLLASDLHQLQAEAVRKALASTFSLADAYKQGFQPLLEEAVLANRSTDIAAMETAYVTFVDSTPAASFAALSWTPAAGSTAGRAPGAGKAAPLPGVPPSLASFCALISRLTEQQRSIAAMKKQEDVGALREVVACQLELDSEAESAGEEVKDILRAAEDPALLSATAESAGCLARLGGLSDRLAASQADAGRAAAHRRALNLPAAPDEALQQCAAAVRLRLQLWRSSATWAAAVASWHSIPFLKLDVPAVDAIVARYEALLQDMVTLKLRQDVERMRAALPVLVAVHNPALRERHWARVQTILGNIFVREELPLGDLLVMGALSAREALAAVSGDASGEAALEELLGRLSARWAGLEIPLVPYQGAKDTWVLGPLEELTTALEDSLVNVSTILSSRYAAGVRADAERMERSLRQLAGLLDEWSGAQRSWLWLDCIFAAPDIQRHMPHEAKAFSAVDRQLRATNRAASGNANALHTAMAPGLLLSLQRHNGTLEKIGRNLEDYLETKRQAFPRFYFLSNQELLDILAQSKSAEAVQPHVRKCFEGVRRLEFGEGASEVVALVSGEGERIMLAKPVKARGGVESWLGGVEAAMGVTLRRLCHAAMHTYTPQSRTDWMVGQPAQLAQATAQTMWCADVERALAAPNQPAALAGLGRGCVTQLAELAALVRAELAPVARLSVASLVTLFVHARDVTAAQLREGGSSTEDFSWQAELRYTWSDVTDEILISQVAARFTYGYEYLGASPRLMCTPLVNRCFITLTGALHLKLGGAASGPAGTGKTETCKDLSRALGVNCIVFNCGSNVDYRLLGRFFSGLAQTGAWACFDEFNRIDVEVLSVVAQQLLTLQNALKADLPRLNFEGRSIRLQPTCGVFITMNPGAYHGRTELPDNLKALFRPCSMTIPDYALVAEVILFSEGFEEAQDLAKKVVALYRLASEQLTQQDLYDWGMRALKSVLAIAGGLKRQRGHAAEAGLLVEALTNANLPKLLSGDVALFNNLLADLFPQATHAAPADEVLEAAIHAVLQERGLKTSAALVGKVLQLWQTMQVRFGVCVVGPAASGKSTVIRTLQGALTRLHEDGLASCLIRAAVADTSMGHKWLVFDGPIDCGWIENLNTVLDDNCALCLPNGERIRLNAQTMRLVFEASDLAAASPATVSRCGMIHIPADLISWQPIAATFVERGLPSELLSETRSYIQMLFERFIGRGLVWLRAQSSAEYISSIDASLVATFADLFKSLLAASLAGPASANYTSFGLDELQPLLAHIFAFSSQQQILVPTVDTVRVAFLIEACLDVQRPVLLTGTTGVGKSLVAATALDGLRVRKGALPFGISFSAQTAASDTQAFMESKLEKKRRTKFGAPAGRKIVFFVDDVNMPAQDLFGAQPPVELLRHFQDYKGFYDPSSRASSWLHPAA
ncbi:hypothetical protein WJX81_007516 [Elliptochloris bilobata]|uniref:Dynein heavy chain n=1 Tax=Elliptochloris bilobata TaxID=381761 RepID=A0AAW1S5M7_9CHLO